MPDRAAAQLAPSKIVAPGDDERARHGAELVGPHDAGKAHKVPDRVLTGPPGLRVAQIGEHSISGGTSARWWNSAVVRSRETRRGAFRSGAGRSLRRASRSFQSALVGTPPSCKLIDHHADSRLKTWRWPGRYRGACPTDNAIWRQRHRVVVGNDGPIPRASRFLYGWSVSVT